ncbi:MAG: hypothetical protein ABIP51_05105 [Bacteroidia bacterium]
MFISLAIAVLIITIKAIITPPKCCNCNKKLTMIDISDKNEEENELLFLCEDCRNKIINLKKENEKSNF